MPIRDTLIEKEAQKHVIVLDDAQTIRAAVTLLGERGYPAENNVFLVVALADGPYRAANFLKLGAILEEVGWEQVDAPLSELPLPPAEVVHRASESSGDFIDRVNNSPGKPFVVIDDINFVALFFNPNLSDTGVGHGVVQKVSTIPVAASSQQIHIVHIWRDPKTGRDVIHSFRYNKKPSGKYICQGCSKKINASGAEITG